MHMIDKGYCADPLCNWRSGRILAPIFHERFIDMSVTQVMIPLYICSDRNRQNEEK
jgi:hypothetical protein